MAGSMQLLRAELPLSGEQAQLMDIVLRESSRLNEIIRNFLAYARPQRGASRRVDVRRMVVGHVRAAAQQPGSPGRSRAPGRSCDDAPVAARQTRRSCARSCGTSPRNALRAMPQRRHADVPRRARDDRRAAGWPRSPLRTRASA